MEGVDLRLRGDPPYLVQRAEGDPGGQSRHCAGPQLPGQRHHQADRGRHAEGGEQVGGGRPGEPWEQPGRQVQEEDVGGIAGRMGGAQGGADELELGGVGLAYPGIDPCGVEAQEEERGGERSESRERPLRMGLIRHGELLVRRDDQDRLPRVGEDLEGEVVAAERSPGRRAWRPRTMRS